MIVWYNNIIPFKGFKALNFLGLILFVRKGCAMSDKDMQHEYIHSKQYIEMLWIFFLIWYGIEWLIKTIKHKDGHLAYRNIGFEKEAYNNESVPNYLNNRKHYNWFKLI